MNWHEYVAKAGKLPEWPYPVNYGKEHIIESDVLVVGGGVAGCRAAIEARKRGATVAVADRGFAKRSGQGGAGVDHWHGAVTNPCSKVTPKMYSEVAMECESGYTNGMARFIIGTEGYDTLLEVEQMGVQIRDEDDEFKDTMFRDEETKLLFAYDVEAKHCLRIYGYNIKPCVDAEMRRLGTDVYDRICITSLLTEGGRQGARVIGATGVHDRTGEFYIFKAKAVIIATGLGARLFGFAPEITESASMHNLNQTAIGHTIGWNAGAEFVMMDMVQDYVLSGFGYAPYSTGNSDNTYQGAPAVDAEGKRISYANSYGELLTEERQIFQPSRPDKFVIGHGIELQMTNPATTKDYKITGLDPDIGKKVKNGELQLPLYTDMTILDEKHRRLLWGMMLSQEGKCRVPIYETMTEWGFDPAKDILQMPVYEPDLYPFPSSWCGVGVAHPQNWRCMGAGGFLTDWRLQTTLPGLFAAGGAPVFCSGSNGESQTSGRYSGRQAAAFARRNDAVEPDHEQIRKEKERCFAPINREYGDVGWKEMNYAIARVMQDYCGKYKTEHTLNLGLKRLSDLQETEGERTYANNPHELCRLLETFSLIDLGELAIEAAKARKCSSKLIDFYRLDYPEIDPPEWHCFIPISKKDGKVYSRKLPVDYYLQAPYSSDLEENYQKFAELCNAEID